MPVASAVVDAKAVPPVAAEYHWILLPVATKLATVAAPQKLCADAVGAVGLSLTVTQLMISLNECPAVTSRATLQDAIIAMTQKPIGMCAVVDEEEFKGILVEGDIRRAFSKCQDAITRPITEFMTKNPVTVPSHILAFDALKIMENPQKQITVVPVTTDGKFAGVLRLHDLFKAGFNSSLATK